MSQATDYTIANDTHANVRADINTVLGASVTMNSGSSAPSGTTYAHMLWADTTASPSIVSIRDASNTTWYQLFTDTGLFRSEDGGASAVAYGPASDIDTGIHFGTAATIKGVTAGAERFSFSATEYVFNEPGTDTDIRFEASGVTNALFIQGSDGYIGINNSAPANLIDAQSNGATVAQLSRSSTDTTGPIISIRKSRGTIGSESAVSSGDAIGVLRWYAYHTTGTPGYANCAQIRVFADGAPSTDYVPTRITFDTGSSSASATERMRIDSSGNVRIGSSGSPERLLHVFGDGTGGNIAVTYSNADVFGAYYYGNKSRGTIASPADISAGDSIMAFVANGYLNSAYRQSGSEAFVAHVVSGSVVQAYKKISLANSSGTEVVRLAIGDYVTLTDAVATTLFTAACANNTAAGFMLNYAVEARDASNNIQMQVGEVPVAICNTGGTVTATVGTGHAAQNVTSGTLSVTVAASAANPSVISINANTSLTSTTLRCIYSVTSLSENSITIS